MDAEPRGHTIDGTPWEEPRPPHLPDRLTSISPWVLPFLVVAVFQLWLLWMNQPLSTDQGSVAEYWLETRFQFSEIAGALIGLALFLRHPDARRTLPQVTWGAILLLLAQVMGLIELTLDPVFVALAAPSEELFFFSPMKEAYSIFTSLVAVFGIAFIAIGLTTARQYEDGRSVRGFATVLVILAVVSTAASTVFAMLELTTAEFDVPGTLIGVVIGTLIARFLHTLALSYLVVVAVAGWLAQEAPRPAWRIAAGGAGLLLIQAWIAPVIGLLALSQEGILGVVGLIRDGVFVGWVLLVVAFALGLPSIESVPDDETEGATLDRPAVTTPGSAAG